MRFWSTAVLLAVCFIVLGLGIHTESLQSIERSIGDFFFRLRSEDWNGVVEGFSMLGTTAGFAAALALALGWTLLYLRRGAYAIWLTVSLVGAWLLNKGLKLLFHRERPDLWDSLVAPDGYSFPSGNAMISAAFYGLVAMLLLTSSKKGNRIWGTAVVFMILLIGISRLYLGVHFAGDIVGGFLAGSIVAMLCYRAVNRTHVRS